MKHESQLTADQQKAVRFLREHPNAGLYADVGTGKTAAALTAIKGLIDGFDVRRVLVVGPRLVAERVWHTEVSEWSHLRGLRVSRIIGTREQRLRAMDADADIYTITRDNVVWLESLFIQMVGTKRVQYRRWPFDLVVLDESQSFKSQSSKRFKSMRRLRRLFDRCWLLTGSLMPNGYEDLWSQLYLLDGGKRLGLTETAYHQEYFKCEVRDGIPRREILPEAGKRIEEKIADILCIMRDAQPPAPTNIIKVQLDKPELTVYRRMVRQSVLEIGDSQISAVNAGALFIKLAQLSNGAIYDEGQ